MSKKVRVAGLVKESIVDGPGIRFVIFSQGCKHSCEGCQNQHTHSFDGGSEMDLEFIYKQIESNPLLDGVTFSGGEPFEQADALGDLAIMVKDKGLNVLTYTGYTFEELQMNTDKHEGWKKLLETSDVLIDGPFLINEKSLNLRFRGSKNQRAIDVRKSLKKGEPVLFEFD